MKEKQDIIIYAVHYSMRTTIGWIILHAVVSLQRPPETQFISTSTVRLFGRKKRPPRKCDLTSLALVAPSRHDPGHHLFLGNQVVDALQVAQKALHVTAPFVQHVVGITGLGEADQPSRAVDLGVNRLRCDQVANVFLSFFLSQIQELRQTTHLNPRVIFSHHSHIVLDHTLPEVLPSPVRLIVGRRARLGFEDVCVAQVRAELLRNHRPTHQFGDRKQLNQTLFIGNLREAAILLNAVQKI